MPFKDFIDWYVIWKIISSFLLLMGETLCASDFTALMKIEIEIIQSLLKKIATELYL